MGRAGRVDRRTRACRGSSDARARAGQAVFVTLRDGTGELQLFVSQADLGDDAFARFRDDVDRGDWVGVEGAVMKTKKGELSVQVQSFERAGPKSLRQLPDKWHGLADVDTRYRQRYVDLIANDEARRVFDDSLRASSPRCARFLERPRLRRGRDACAAPGRRRCDRASVRHAPQRARHASSPCESRPSSI